MIEEPEKCVVLVLFGNNKFYENNETADDSSAYTIVDYLFWWIDWGYTMNVKLSIDRARHFSILDPQMTRLSHYLHLRP